MQSIGSIRQWEQHDIIHVVPLNNNFSLTTKHYASNCCCFQKLGLLLYIQDFEFLSPFKETHRSDGK